MLSVEQVNRARCGNDVGFGGAHIRWLRLRPIERSRNNAELSCDLKGFGICLTTMVEKERIHKITEE